MNLAELQRTFWDSARGDADLAALDLLFTPHGSRSGAERFRVYNGAYFVRLERCLAEVFRQVADLVGEARFKALARAYVKAHPSRSPAIESAGDRFADFLRSSPAVPRLLQGADAPLPEPVVLADLATLEGARLAALLAPNPERIAIASEVDTTTLATAKLALNPGAIRARVGARALALWTPTAAQDQSAARTVVFFRPRLTVHHVVLEEDEAAALDHIARGESIAVACGALAEHPDPVRRALLMVGGWFQRGWVAAVIDAQPSKEIQWP